MLSEVHMCEYSFSFRRIKNCILLNSYGYYNLQEGKSCSYYVKVGTNYVTSLKNPTSLKCNYWFVHTISLETCCPSQLFKHVTLVPTFTACKPQFFSEDGNYDTNPRLCLEVVIMWVTAINWLLTAHFSPLFLRVAFCIETYQINSLSVWGYRTAPA